MYKLPHQLDRPYQAEILKWILESKKKYLILKAPTGFGKSPLPAATGIDFRTLVLVLHKSLQSANYRDIYKFDILYGKSNYICKKPKKQLDIPGIEQVRFTAYDCGNQDCLCPYQAQVVRCLGSKHVSLNYAKFLMTRDFAESYGPEILFCDEAHNLPDIVTEFVGITLDYDNEFLQCIGSIKPAKPMILNYEEAMSIFRQLSRACERNKPSKEDLKRWRKWKRLRTKIQITNEILANNGLKDWYYETTDKHLLIKPLTAKYHFNNLFGVANKVVLMSATITPGIIERLGIDEDDFDYKSVPSVYPIPTRLIYDLMGPAINYKSNEADKDKQARLIAEVLNPNSSGIIHTTSKAQSFELMGRLKHYTNLSFHVPDIGIGTEKQLDQWYEVRQPGTYCVSWSFHEGVDLGGDNINIMAKTPYASLGSNYERAKKDYDPAWYLEKTGYTMIQLFGRHQRIKQHYNKNKLAFIADSAYHRLKSQLDDDFRARIRRWNGN